MIPASEADKLGRVFESWAFDPGWNGSGADAIQLSLANVVASSPEFLAELGLSAADLTERPAYYQGDDWIPEQWTVSQRARDALRGMAVRRQGYAGLADGRVFTIADSSGRVRAMGTPYSYQPGRDLALSLVRGLAVVGAAWAVASAAGIATAAPATAAAPTAAEAVAAIEAAAPAAGYLDAAVIADAAAEAAALGAATGVGDALAAQLIALPGLSGVTAGAAAAAAGAAAASSGGSSLLQTIAAQGAAAATKATGTAITAAITQALAPSSGASGAAPGAAQAMATGTAPPQWQTWAALAAVVAAVVVAFT